MQWKRWAQLLLLLTMVCISALSCSVNILENFADKNTNEALYYDALDLLNDGNYVGAIEKIALMTGEYTGNREVITLKASAYAGLCGLNFLTLVEAIKGMGSTRLMPFLLSTFKSGSTSKIDNCVVAEDLIESIGSTAERTSDENMFLVLISFAKIGNVLSLYADSGQDGVVETNYDPCASGSSRVAGDLFDTDVRQLGTGITLAINNISAVDSTVDLADGSLSSINSACASLATLNPSYNFCSITNPADFTSSHLKGIRSILKESSTVGLGANCTGDISACNCP